MPREAAGLSWEQRKSGANLFHLPHTQLAKNAVTASTTYGVAQSQQQPSYGVQRLDRSSGALNYFLFFAVAKYHEGGWGWRRRERNGEASHNRFYEWNQNSIKCHALDDGRTDGRASEPANGMLEQSVDNNRIEALAATFVVKQQQRHSTTLIKCY